MHIVLSESAAHERNIIYIVIFVHRVCVFSSMLFVKLWGLSLGDGINIFKKRVKRKQLITKKNLQKKPTGLSRHRAERVRSVSVPSCPRRTRRRRLSRTTHRRRRFKGVTMVSGASCAQLLAHSSCMRSRRRLLVVVVSRHSTSCVHFFRRTYTTNTRAPRAHAHARTTSPTQNNRRALRRRLSIVSRGTNNRRRFLCSRRCVSMAGGDGGGGGGRVCARRGGATMAVAERTGGGVRGRVRSEGGTGLSRWAWGSASGTGRKKSIVYGSAAGRVCVRADDGRSPRFRRPASSCRARGLSCQQWFCRLATV